MGARVRARVAVRAANWACAVAVVVVWGTMVAVGTSEARAAAAGPVAGVGSVGEAPGAYGDVARRVEQDGFVPDLCFLGGGVDLSGASHARQTWLQRLPTAGWGALRAADQAGGSEWWAAVGVAFTPNRCGCLGPWYGAGRFWPVSRATVPEVIDASACGGVLSRAVWWLGGQVVDVFCLFAVFGDAVRCAGSVGLCGGVRVISRIMGVVVRSLFSMVVLLVFDPTWVMRVVASLAWICAGGSVLGVLPLVLVLVQRGICVAIRAAFSVVCWVLWTNGVSLEALGPPNMRACVGVFGSLLRVVRAVLGIVFVVTWARGVGRLLDYSARHRGFRRVCVDCYGAMSTGFCFFVVQ